MAIDAETKRICAWLFDKNFYYHQLTANGKKSPWLYKLYKQLQLLFHHYLHFGARNSCSPHLYFDAEYYQNTYLKGDKNTNPLVHYATEGWKQKNKCHPTFFVDDLYLKDHPGIEGIMPPVVHYLSTTANIMPLTSPYNFMHTQEFRDYCDEIGAPYELAMTQVHPEDFTMNYHIFQSEFKYNVKQPIEFYFSDGKNCVEVLLDSLEQSGFDTKKDFSLLEFACGFGRVSRFFAKQENIDLTVSDIHPKAMELLGEKIGVKTQVSTFLPEEYTTPEQYDVIFCLSFFTHMPKRTWYPWLEALFKRLKKGGRLVVTTHGETPIQLRGIKLDDEGFYFTEETEQLDLPLEHYGYTAVSRAFVEKNIAKLPGKATLRTFLKDNYWNIQDAYVIEKE